jgi:hypothetical protein
MLHAAALEFVHPTTGVIVRCTSPDPADMEGLCRTLGLDG